MCLEGRTVVRNRWQATNENKLTPFPWGRCVRLLDRTNIFPPSVWIFACLLQHIHSPFVPFHSSTATSHIITSCLRLVVLVLLVTYPVHFSPRNNVYTRDGSPLGEWVSRFLPSSFSFASYLTSSLTGITSHMTV